MNPTRQPKQLNDGRVSVTIHPDEYANLTRAEVELASRPEEAEASGTAVLIDGEWVTVAPRRQKGGR